jgi:lipoprotein-releasing system permease protein
LVILLSAFNGIEKMIEILYSEYDSDITISAAKSKTFYETQIKWQELSKTPGLKSYSKAIEEIVVLRHEKKWVNATLVGIENNFLETIALKKHMVIGEPIIFNSGSENAFGVIGGGLMQKLDARIGDSTNRESIIVYAPKRNVKIRPGKSPFYMERMFLSGAMNYNREINEEKVLWPLKNVRELLQYDNELTHVFVEVDTTSGFSNEGVKEKLKLILGNSFRVKTNFEKNEIIYKTSKSERVVVEVIMLFIFILASFNLIASITMLYLEKKDNMQTLKSIGMTKKNLFQIFLFEGLLISGTGIFFGLILGYIICFVQVYLPLLIIPGAGVPFPISFSVIDFLFILFSVSSLSFIFSYFPVKIMFRNDKNLMIKQ